VFAAIRLQHPAQRANLWLPTAGGGSNSCCHPLRRPAGRPAFQHPLDRRSMHFQQAANAASWMATPQGAPCRWQASASKCHARHPQTTPSYGIPQGTAAGQANQNQGGVPQHCPKTPPRCHHAGRRMPRLAWADGSHRGNAPVSLGERPIAGFSGIWGASQGKGQGPPGGMIHAAQPARAGISPWLSA